MYAPVNETIQGNLVLARCLQATGGEGSGYMEAEWVTPDGLPRRVTAACLQGIQAGPGDPVLLAPVSGDPEWVALGVLGQAPENGTTKSSVLPASGFQWEQATRDGEDHLALRRPSGQVELEIRIVDGRTHLRCPTRDAVLECDGNFEVRAGEAIRLKGTHCEVDVGQDMHMKAGGKIRIEAAQQELCTRQGELRLNAKQNLVLWGEFILLNTKDEQPWKSKT